MKRLKFILLFVLTVFFAVGTANVVYADEISGGNEIPAVEGVEGVEKAEPTEEKELDGLTEADIKNIINAVLTDKQKEQAEKTASVIADKFGLNDTTAYIAAAIAVIIVGAIVVLVAKLVSEKVKNGKASEKLKALNAVLTDREGTTEKLLNLAGNLDEDKIKEYLLSALNGSKEELVASITEGLKVDRETSKTIVGEVSTLTAQVHTIIEALQILALNGNQVAMANKLSENAIAKNYNDLAYENQLLKTALGEEAYKKAVENNGEKA